MPTVALKPARSIESKSMKSRPGVAVRPEIARLAADIHALATPSRQRRQRGERSASSPTSGKCRERSPCSGVSTSMKSPNCRNSYFSMPAPAPTYGVTAAGIHARLLISRPRGVTANFTTAADVRLAQPGRLCDGQPLVVDEIAVLGVLARPREVEPGDCAQRAESRRPRRRRRSPAR